MIVAANRNFARSAIPTLLAMTYAISGCAYGTAMYDPPVPPLEVGNEKVVEAPRTEVWDRAIPELGKHFFVINNIDKSSGLISLSFSGDPEQYVDCGQIHSEVVGSMEDETYDFAGASEHQRYEVVLDNQAWQVERTMALEGRTNVILQEIDTETTKISVNTRYIVSRTLVLQLNLDIKSVTSDTIHFNSKGHSSFPMGRDRIGTTCYANGKLEDDILRLIR